ncbi:uncharacterized protein LOC119720682 [Patiria miniata]|uniref:Uncharacterized protein n=1 Tax=Patiria miniata TaxID=46514 RepID=A0A913Z6G5_PATMI|nr:uncharacterized protein LOC119720682 [Patiria miniata]
MPSHMWQGDDPPHSIQDVYDYIDRELKTLKVRLINKIEKLFYGGIEPIQFLIHVEEIFKTKHRVKRIKNLVPRVASWADVDLFARTSNEVRRPGGVRDAGFSKDLNTFMHAFQRAVKALSDLLEDVRDLYTIVQSFCRNYQSLEGEFDLKWARATNLELKNNLQGTAVLLNESQTGVNQKLFSSDKFSLEVAETCDTKRYPVLRLMPDLFQKFHFVLHLLGKWRANDQIYMEDIQFKLIKTKRLQRLKQEEYNTLELEHGNILSNIVEKRVRVRAREIRERIKQLDAEINKLHLLKKNMVAEKTQTEQDVLERKRVMFLNKNTTDISKDIENILGLKKDVEILGKKLKSLNKSIKLNDHDLQTRVKEKQDLGQDYNEMRSATSRSNQLAFERTELSKEISIINEKIQELETIFYRKTDKHKLAQAFDEVQKSLEESQ